MLHTLNIIQLEENSRFNYMIRVLIPFFALVNALVPVATAQPSALTASAFLTQYCVTCHNARLKTAGLTLDPSDLSRIGATAEIWERVVRKLRSGTMPPTGVPRPPQTAYDNVAIYLETEL